MPRPPAISLTPRRTPDGALVGSLFLVFDGRCGFCTWSVLQAHCLDRVARFTYVPYQVLTEADFERFHTSAERCSKAVHVVANGRTYRGAFAVNRFLWSFRKARPFIVLLYSCWPLLAAEVALYALVARYRIPISALLGTRRYAALAD